MEIKDKIRTLRKLHCLSQEDMAARLDMSPNGYAKIERGKRRLDIPKLEQIAAVFGVTAAELMAADGGLSRQDNGRDSEALLHEIAVLKLMLAHQEEIMAQKQQQFDELMAARQREIDLLHELAASLRTQAA